MCPTVIAPYVPERWGDRRRFLKGAGLLVGGGAGWFAVSTDDRLGGSGGLTAEAAAGATEATVHVDLEADGSEWAVDERVFGKFIEHNGRDVYPGLYSDHLANGSFEVWNRTGRRTSLLFDVQEHDGVAHGWEPADASGTVAFEQVVGGVHGRRATPDLDWGAEVPDWIRPSPTGVTRPRFQRVHVDGRGGVRQRTALPDARTFAYEVELSVRGEGVSACEVELSGPDGATLAGSAVPVGDAWTRHAVELDLDERSGERYRGSPFGVYDLSLVGEGAGRLDLDWVVLRAGDAVAGKFNPTTLRLLREFNVTSLRWPGGNFASQYHWRDGVGPLADRPVVPNCNWGGLERNSLGTDEFLEFCELADVEPLVTVGSWSAIGPAEAAAWVEYVNGDPSTEMGALRAANGHPEPWDITAWQVGNEVWGTYQVGHQPAGRYADRYERYHEAMTAVDPSIEVDATGIDPGWTDHGDGSVVGRGPGRRPTWNDRLCERAGRSVEGLDVHRYSAGIRSDAARRLWCLEHGADAVDYNEVLVNFPTQFDRVVGELGDRAAGHGVEDLRVTVGEWNLQPFVHEGWPRAGYPTTAHAAYVASMFNAFVRRGDAVRQAHMRDNTLYYRPYPRDLRPVNPGNYAQRFYAEPFVETDAAWHHLPVDVECATFTIPRTGFRVRRSEDVPYLDAAAVRSSDGETVVYAVNRSLRSTCEVAVSVGGWGNAVPESVPLTLLAGAGGDPFARQTDWEAVDGFALTESTLSPDADGRLVVAMPPASVAKLALGRRDA